MVNFRWVTSACMLDYSTVVIGDKFGSISVIRLPKDTNEDTQVHFTTSGLYFDLLWYVEDGGKLIQFLWGKILSETGSKLSKWIKYLPCPTSSSYCNKLFRTIQVEPKHFGHVAI